MSLEKWGKTALPPLGPNGCWVFGRPHGTRSVSQSKENTAIAQRNGGCRKKRSKKRSLPTAVQSQAEIQTE